jgi:XTP/dITP diphosphohydrolase
MKNLIFVTQNPNKVRDAKKLLPEFSIEHIDFEVPEIQSMDLQEIAERKLQYAYKKVQKPCFVMDAALSLDCLNGFPGPFIKWWFEKTVGEEKTCKIAGLFKEYDCQWTTILGYFDGHDKHFLQETIKGNIANEPRGENGYHWDTIFIPEGEMRTFAEMSFEEKQSYAVTRKLLERLKDLVQG